MSDRIAERPPAQAEAAKEQRGHEALYFFGVARVRTWRSGKPDDGDAARVRYRDIEALVRPVPWQLPSSDPAQVMAHQRVLEAAMRRGTVLPAPFGIVFRGRRSLVRMLEEQYLVLDEGLSFLEGHWELRLHIAAAQGAERGPALDDVAMDLYSELRRQARAAVPLPGDGTRILSAAFLVDRTTWVEFIERAEDLGAAHPELAFDITGPWPPYDFVRIA